MEIAVTIQLSADDQTFTASTPTPFGCTFSAVPVVALGSLKVEISVKHL